MMDYLSAFAWQWSQLSLGNQLICMACVAFDLAAVAIMFKFGKENG